MPMVPPIPGGSGASGASPMSQPSLDNLLMAAADLHQTGAFASFKQPNPVKPHSPKKKLKVIK